MIKFFLFLLIFLSPFTKSFSQDKCTEFAEVKHKNQIKACYGFTYFYGDFYFKSIGIEFLRESKLKIKDKFNFLYGISYFYRPLVENRSNPFNKVDVQGANGSLVFKHHYIELPLILATTNKKKNLYFGLAPVFLMYGSLDFGSPTYFVKYSFGKISYLTKNAEIISYNYFFNPLNLKLQIGCSYTLTKNIKTGIDLSGYIIPIGKNYNCGPSFLKCEKRKPFLLTSSIYLSINF